MRSRRQYLEENMAETVGAKKEQAKVDEIPFDSLVHPSRALMDGSKYY